MWAGWQVEDIEEVVKDSPHFLLIILPSVLFQLFIFLEDCEVCHAKSDESQTAERDTNDELDNGFPVVRQMG